MTRDEAVKILRGSIMVAGRQNGRTLFIEAIGTAIDEITKEPEIIRCHECKHFIREIDGCYDGCEMWLDGGNEIPVGENDYCSYAEKAGE